jgi:transmembrane protein
MTHMEKSSMPTKKPLSAAPGRVAGPNSATIIRTARHWVACRSASACHWLARAGLCLAFTYSGVSKLVDFHSAIAEQADIGLPHPALFAATTIATQLTGSALVLLARGFPAASGAALLAGFTVIATLLGHQFWHETGMQRVADLYSFLEHFGLIGGFVLTAMIETGQITKLSMQRARP